MPHQVFEVAAVPDGGTDHLILAAGSGAKYVKFCVVAKLPELGVDPLFATNQNRLAYRSQLVPICEAVMLTRGKADWLAALQAARLPCGAINNLAEVFDDPQVAARDRADHWQHPVKNNLRLVASPIGLSATPVRREASGGLPPPRLGQHTDEVLPTALHYSDVPLAKLHHVNGV